MPKQDSGLGTELRLVPVLPQDSGREAESRASVIAVSSSGLVPSLPLLYLGFPPKSPKGGLCLPL